jgi:hypothetical protein
MFLELSYLAWRESLRTRRDANPSFSCPKTLHIELLVTIRRVGEALRDLGASGCHQAGVRFVLTCGALVLLVQSPTAVKPCLPIENGPPLSEPLLTGPGCHIVKMPKTSSFGNLFCLGLGCAHLYGFPPCSLHDQATNVRCSMTSNTCNLSSSSTSQLP